MPFVRFSRDRRGYEHVYLIDSPARGGRSRILYWFRTPPGVKVGRSPFDAETQRSLERQNPGVQFDWPQIVAARIPPPVPVENWREKRRVERAIKRARSTESAEAADGERIAADAQVSLPDELEDSDGTIDTRPDEFADQAEHTPRELTVQPVEELIPDPATPAEGISAPQAAPIAPGGERRGRRRRRRRARAPGHGDVSSGQNGPLDPAEPVEKPSNEG